MSDYDVVPLALPACAPLSFNGGFTTHQVRLLFTENMKATEASTVYKVLFFIVVLL